jgi:hypothetical protein
MAASPKANVQRPTSMTVLEYLARIGGIMGDTASWLLGISGVSFVKS